MKMLLFNYSPELDKRITNLSALPQGVIRTLRPLPDRTRGADGVGVVEGTDP
jgi:hypothetical protein